MLNTQEPGYSVLELDLTTARDKVRMPFAGGLFTVLHTSSSSTKFTVQFNTDQADEIEAYRNFKYKGPFNVFYLSNDALAGQSVTLIIIGNPDLVDIEQLRMDLAGAVDADVIPGGNFNESTDVIVAAGAATALYGPGSDFRHSWASADINNVATLRVGGSTASATRGIPLAPGETIFVPTSGAVYVYNPGAIACKASRAWVKI